MFVLLFFLLWGSVQAIDIAVCNQTPGGRSCDLAVCLAYHEMIIRDSIQISVDCPSCVVASWNIDQELVEEYVVPLKLRKKVYTDSFCVNVLFEQERDVAQDVSLYLSCFVVVGDERVVPVVKSVLLRGVAQKEHAQKKTHAIVLPLYRRIDDRPIWLLNTEFLLIVLLMVLFVGFLIVDVLSFVDLVAFLMLGGWIYFGRLVFSDFVLMLVSALWLLLLCLWLFYDPRQSSKSFWVIRTVLGFLCAGMVVPLLVQAFLVLFC